MTLEQIAEKCNLTRERVRQICTKGIDYLYGEIKPGKCDNLYYNKVVSQSEDWTYLTDKFKKEDVIKSSSVEEVLKQENCNLTASIGLLIIQRIFDGQYCVVGNRLYDMNARSKSSWNNSFVVKKELVEAFDLMICVVPWNVISRSMMLKHKYVKQLKSLSWISLFHLGICLKVLKWKRLVRLFLKF